MNIEYIVLNAESPNSKWCFHCLNGNYNKKMEIMKDLRKGSQSPLKHKGQKKNLQLE